YEWVEIQGQVDTLIELYDFQDNEKTVRLMKQLIPEYVSMNSPFEKIDIELGRIPE
ncbi:MAG: hypothetical protein GWP27_07260, partial [Bacteroidetes bacterium]|nr:hypothetical protein [Bacteroidota bacterium]